MERVAWVMAAELVTDSDSKIISSQFTGPS